MRRGHRLRARETPAHLQLGSRDQSPQAICATKPVGELRLGQQTARKDAEALPGSELRGSFTIGLRQAFPSTSSAGRSSHNCGAAARGGEHGKGDAAVSCGVARIDKVTLRTKETGDIVNLELPSPRPR